MLISIEWGYFAFYYLLNFIGRLPRTVLSFELNTHEYITMNSEILVTM